MKSLSAAALLAACVLILGCPGGGGCGGGGGPGNDAGVTPASITLSDGPEHDFGSRPVGTSQDHTFTLTNAGALKATQLLPQGIPGPFAFKGGSFPGTGGTCGAELEIGSSCAVTVTFTPVASGSFTSSLAFSFHDGNGTKSVTRTLKGSASTPAQVAISDGDTYDFGPQAVGASVDHTFTVTNTGGLAATSLAATGLEVPFAFKGGSYPGQGGTCGTSLPSLSACTLVVTYAPTQMGNALRPLKLIFSDGANVQTVTHAVSGTAIVPAWLSFSDAPRFDYGTRAVGSSNEHAFTLVNSGGVTATGLGPAFGLAAPYSFKGGSYPGVGGTCGASLAANDRCVVVVTYAPTATGATTGTVGVVYTDGAGIRTASRELAGAATTQAALSLSDGPSYDFGVLVTGTSVDHTFQLSNSGPSAANMLAGAALSAPFSYKGGSYPGLGGTCGNVLTGNSTCTLVVTYAPAADGPATGALDINYHSGVQAVTVSRGLSGRSTRRAALSLSDAPGYDFGIAPIGGQATHAFTVTNSGAATANNLSASPLAAPFAFKDGAYPGQGGTCGTSLSAGGSCTLVVVFAPSATGIANALLGLSYSDGTGNQQVTRVLNGSGANPASLTLSDGPAYDYGTRPRGSATDHAFTVTNAGGLAAANLTASALAAPFSFKGGSYPGQGGTCGNSLPPSNACTVVVTYAPASTGAASGSLTLGYQDGANARTVSRALSGTAAAPAQLSLSDAPGFDFGAQAVGSTSEHAFTVTNPGGVAATNLSASALSAPFAFKGGSYPGTGGTCGTGLVPTGACTILVTYAPTSAGTASGTLSLSYDDGLGARSVDRSLAGTAAAPALLSFAGFDFGVRLAGGTAEHTITVTNSGGVLASGLSASGLSAPFGFKGGTFPGQGGACGAALAPGASCTTVVTFSPASPGAYAATLALSYSDGLSARTVGQPLTGSGASAAQLAFTEASHGFGRVAIGASAEHAFTVVNSGGLTATGLAPALSSAFSFKGGGYPGTGGTCGTTLAASASCTILVTYAPNAASAASGSLSLGYNDGGANRSATTQLTGSGHSRATLWATDGAFGSIVVGTSRDVSIQLLNLGGMPAAGLSTLPLNPPFSFKGGSYPGFGGTCGTSLPLDETCTLIVTFEPPGSGTFSDALVLGYHDGVAPRTESIALSGSAAGPAVVSFAGFDFGTRLVGTAADHAFTFTNSGELGASQLNLAALPAPFSYKGGGFPGQGGTCGSLLAAGASCTVVVTFAPTAAGVTTTSLALTYWDGIATRTAAQVVRGVGASAASLAFTEPSFDFGTRAIGSATDHTFTVTNSGGATATGLNAGVLTAPFAFKGGSYPGVGGTCSGSLGGSNSCTLVVTYAPTATGTSSGNLSLGYNDGATNRSTGPLLSGTGANAATVSFSGFDFGNRPVGSSSDTAFTLVNTGGVAASALTALPLTAPFSFKGGSYPGTGGTCGPSLAASSSCTVVVTFAPTFAGAASDTLAFSFHDGVTTRSSNRPLTGNASTPASLSFAGHDYGTLLVPAVAERTFTVTNSGGSTATGLSSGALTAPFAFKGGGGFPGQGGTCGTTLAAGASCAMIVTFSPTTNGAFSATLALTYSDGLGFRTAAGALSGTGATPAALALSDGPTYDYGTRATGSVTEKAFTVTNSGGVTATGLAPTLGAPFAFKGGAYPGIGGNCSATLPASGSCTVVVTFAPTAAGPASGNLALSYDDGAAPRTVSRALSGVGAAPAALAFSGFDYGTQGIGSATDRAFTVSNTGGVAATALVAGTPALPFFFKGGSYPGTGGTCGVSVPAGGSCTVVVTFAPSAQGAASATLAFTYSDGATSQTTGRPLTGVGANPAALSISNGPTYDFGPRTAGSVTEHAFAVTNTGGLDATGLASLALSSPFGFKGGSFPGQGGTCGTLLPASTTCFVVVTFSPSTTGAASGTLTLTYSNGVSSQTAARALAGSGAVPASLSVSDDPSYSYGTKTVGTSTDKTFTFTNSGGVTARDMTPQPLAPGFAFKGGSYPGTGGTCGATLSPSASCTVVVTFAPTGTGGFSALVSTVYNDGAVSRTASRPISGTGASPASLSISNSPSFNYGNKIIGSVTDRSFTVSNNGSTQATSISATAFTGPFNFKGGSYPGTGGTCGTTLNGFGSCSVVVSFAPTAAGPASDTLTLSYFNGVSTQTATRGLTGTGLSPAVLTINGGSVAGFGTIGVGNSAHRIFNVTNTGTSTATITAQSFTGPFSFRGGVYPGAGGTCGERVFPGASCRIAVSFSPTSTGAASGSVSIVYNDGAVSQTVTQALGGAGTNAALLAVTDWPAVTYTYQPGLQDGPSFDFGPVGVGARVDQTFTVTNTGAVVATSVAGAALSAPFAYKGGGFPGQGGTCGTVLNAGASCTIVVSYNPSSGTASSGSLGVSYDDGSGLRSSSRALTGTGTALAALAVRDEKGGPNVGTSFDYGPVGVNQTADHVFRVVNQGSATATALAPSAFSTAGFTFTGGTYPGRTGSCGTSLPAGASCTLSVRFAPTAAGGASAQLALGYHNGASAQTASRALSGAGVSGSLLVIQDPPDTEGLRPYDFGSRAVGTVGNHVVLVTNVGGAEAAVTYDAPAAPFNQTTSSYNCDRILPGRSCAVILSYAPVSVGASTAGYFVRYADYLGTFGYDSTASLVMTGNATSQAFLSYSDVQGGQAVTSPLDFGTSGMAADRLVYVTNTGVVAATGLSAAALPAPFSFRGGSYPGMGGTCGTSLAVNATCVLALSFTPVSSTTSGATLSLSYNDGSVVRTLSRPLVGTGTSRALLELAECPGCAAEDDATDFGTRATPADRILTVRNLGGQTATGLGDGGGLGNGFAFRGGSYPGLGGTCGGSLPSGASCTVAVTFTPSGSALRTTTLTLAYNDGVAARTATMALSGAGTDQAFLQMSECATCPPINGAYDFGEGDAYDNVDRVLYLTNTGPQAATGITLTAFEGGGSFDFGGGYYYSYEDYPGLGGTCGTSLAPGATCTVVLTFHPTNTISGPRYGALRLGYNDGVATRTLSQPLIGEHVYGTALAIAECPACEGTSAPVDFGATGQVVERTVWLVPPGSSGSISTQPLSNGFAYKGGTYPGVGGTCGGYLSAPDRCSLVITFTPTGTGPRAAALAIDFYGSYGGSRLITRSLTATATSQALLSISDAPGRTGGELYDFGDAGMAVDHTFTVTNRGATAATTVVPAAGLANGFNYKGGAYPGTGGTCGPTLAAGTSCTVVVTFTPAGTGDRYATLALSYNDGAAGRFASQELTATSVAQAALSITDCPGCQPSPEPYDYGPRGLLRDHVFTVTNTGPVAATGIASGGGFRNGFNFKNGSYPGTGGTCTSTLAPGASCAVVVTFTPSGDRVRTGALTLAYNDGAASRTATRELRAEASTVAVLTMSDCPDCQSSMTPSLVDFGTSGITVDRTFYVTNIGAQTASNMNGFGGYQRFEFKGGYYPGTGGTCGGTLAPGISCTVVMSFIPSNTGPNTEVMSVRYEGLRQYVTRPLVGTPTTRALLNVVDCPTCTATSAAYDFGTAGVTAERTLYVRNVGAVSATAIANGFTLGNGFAFKGGAYPGTGGTCGTSLSSAASCAVVVTFTPSGTGTRQSSLSLNYNDGGAARTATRPVNAAITNRSFLVVSESSTLGGCGDACGPYDFGSALVGSTVERTFTVFNTGALATSGVGDAGVLAPPFGFKGGVFPGTGGTCGNVINAGGSCTLVVRFSPGVVGTSHGSVTLGYVDAQGTQQAGRAVRGIGQ